jgi:uncharacterized protein
LGLKKRGMMENKQADIKEELKKLLELQEFDGRIFEIRSVLSEIPMKESAIETSLESKKSGMQEAEDNLKALQVSKNEKEADIETKEAKIKKYQADLYGIKNNKEFQSLQQEINGIKADISVIEDELLMLFDGIEAARSRFDEEKKRFDDERKASETKKGSLRTEEASLKTELDGLVSKREELSRDVDGEVLSQYRKILDKWGKTSVAAIVGEFCGECNMQLRPQIINECKIAKRLVFCENCARILYAES